MSNNLSFLWHDYETWGVDPRRDRAAQFAGIRTDANLEEIGEPINIYCKPNDDFLPNPESAMITGITPQLTQQKGVGEAEFYTRINDLLLQPGTCGVGYNSLRFDDELTRTGFFRNFIDPYAREWQNGNSRWDIIDLVRMTYALRPEDIEWPLGENDLPSFRLELLTQANGIAHEGAHDALSDVRATIALAKLIKTKKPKLYDFYLKLRSKLEAGRLLNLREQKTVLHISGMYPTEMGCLSPILPLMQHPVNSNEIIAYDLRKSPRHFLSMTSAEMADNLYSKAADLPTGVERIGIKGVHLNKSPALAPINTLSEQRAAHWQIDWQEVEKHRQQLLADSTLLSRLAELYQTHKKEYAQGDAETALYEGFINNNDRTLCNQILKKKPEQLIDWVPSFDDKRLNTIYPRYLARNWPHLLNPQQLQKWREYCEARIIEGEFDSTMTLTEYQNTLEQLAGSDLSEKNLRILQQLVQWCS